MSKLTLERLAELFYEVEAEFPEKSTAFILEVGAERARIAHIKKDCDCSDVAESLVNQ